MKNIEKLSLKISQSLIINKLDNPNFNDDIKGLITQSSLSLDLLV